MTPRRVRSWSTTRDAMNPPSSGNMELRRFRAEIHAAHRAFILQEELRAARALILAEFPKREATS